MANVKSDRKKLIKALATIIIVVLASILGIDLSSTEPTLSPVEATVPIQNIEGQLVVHMIDVGQADCFLLVEDNKTALVDCGTRSTGKDAVDYLNNLGITKLDYVVGTHPHDDHMGGMYDILTNFEIGTVILPDSSDADITANWYAKLITELNNGTYNIDFAEKDEIFNLENATMKVIAAETDVDGNANNYSIVLKVSFGQMDMIMTGDAETEVEEKILEEQIDIDAEILKLGHHGSDTSTCEEFLDAISPEYALISCKVGNKYEHPIKSTMEKLEERNIEVYRTDECSNVVMTITTDDITFNCEPGDYLSGVELEERELK